MDEHQNGVFSIAEEMRALKGEALEKGELTDFSFLVGPDDASAKLLHCFKSDLLLASDYFMALLRSSLTGPPPVRIKHVQPHIFKLILRLLSLHTIDKLACIDDAFALTLAADEFLLDQLKPFCQSEIDRLLTVEIVWQTFNKYNTHPILQPHCIKHKYKKTINNCILSSETRQCLYHPTFLQTSLESLLIFLQLDSMNIASEIELFDACFKLANSLPAANGQELMKAALPHLRLLTLKANELTPELGRFLTDPEKLYLLNGLCPTGIVADLPMPARLNSNPSHRIPTDASMIEPEDHFFGLYNHLDLDQSVYYMKDISNKISCNASTLSLFTRRHIVLAGIDASTCLKNAADLDVEVTVSCHGRVVFSQGYTSNSSPWKFKELVHIPKTVRFEICITLKREVECDLISTKEAQVISKNLSHNGAFSHIFFKNSVDIHLQRNIAKCFLIGKVFYEIK